MSVADLRAGLDFFGLRLTRSARFTIFIFLSDIFKNGEQNVIRINEFNAGKFRPEFGLISGKATV